jgi:glycosyltransferase involved in cell wall biosynthesis
VPGGRPHLLFLAWGFPPSRAGGVYRALATANAFAAAGWDVTVVTAVRETFERYTGVDPTLEDRIDPRVRVERIPFAWPALETDIRQFSWLRVHVPILWRRIHKHTDMIPFPEPGYGPWRATLGEAVERIHREHPVDLALATANPHVAFTAAWLLHERHGVPYVMDYRDAWLLDVFSGDRLHGARSRAARWERRLIAAAREVWFVNEPIRAWHAELYPDRREKMHVVANGFDGEVSARAVRSPEGRPLVFGYVGTLTPKVPLAEFLAGWSAARASAAALAAARVHLWGYLGYYQTPRADMVDRVNDAAADGVSYDGPVGKAEVHATYDRCDVLLLMLGAGRYVTSGKVFEYVSTGLPIVSVHDPGNAASDVLRGYPLWFPVRSLAPEDIAAALVEAAEAARAADQSVRDECLRFAAQYERARQLQPRIDALSASVGLVAHEVTAADLGTAG